MLLSHVVDASLYFREGRAVALKVLARDDTRHQLDVLKKNSRRLLDHLEQPSHFEQPSHRGIHLCLVLEVMWRDALSFCRGFNLKIDCSSPEKFADHYTKDSIQW